MTSRHDDIWADSAAPVLSEHQSRSVSFTDPVANVTGTVGEYVIVGAVRSGEVNDSEGRQVYQERDVTVLDLSKLPSGATIDLYAYFTIDNERWNIHSIESKTGNRAHVTCSRLAYIEASREGYRRDTQGGS